MHLHSTYFKKDSHFESSNLYNDFHVVFLVHSGVGKKVKVSQSMMVVGATRVWDQLSLRDSV